MKRWLPLFLLLSLAGCPAPPTPTLHYVVGAPYEADGVWRYPKADFSYDATGIATIAASPHAPFTTDGERYSADAFAAAHPTLQLPALARVTNLETGRQLVLRINDRGPENPARILAVTPHAAILLGFDASGTARVRVEVLPGPSEQLALSLPGGPRLAIARAPVGAVAVSSLPPLGSPSAANAQAAPPPGAAVAEATPAPAVSPADQPGALSQVPPNPGAIWVQTGLFTGETYASLQASALARFAPTMVPRYASGAAQIEVRIGPFTSVAAADAMLKEVLRSGVSGARLVVE